MSQGLGCLNSPEEGGQVLAAAVFLPEVIWEFRLALPGVIWESCLAVVTLQGLSCALPCQGPTHHPRALQDCHLPPQGHWMLTWHRLWGSFGAGECGKAGRERVLDVDPGGSASQQGFPTVSLLEKGLFKMLQQEIVKSSHKCPKSK